VDVTNSRHGETRGALQRHRWYHGPLAGLNHKSQEVYGITACCRACAALLRTGVVGGAPHDLGPRTRGAGSACPPCTRHAVAALHFWCFNCPLTDKSFARSSRGQRGRSRSLVGVSGCWWRGEARERTRRHKVVCMPSRGRWHHAWVSHTSNCTAQEGGRTMHNKQTTHL
jgi:hypothetical protein